MQFGLSFFPDSHPEDKSGEQYFREALDLTEVQINEDIITFVSLSTMSMRMVVILQTQVFS